MKILQTSNLHWITQDWSYKNIWNCSTLSYSFMLSMQCIEQWNIIMETQQHAWQAQYWIFNCIIEIHKIMNDVFKNNLQLNPFRTKNPKYLFPRGNEPLLYHQIGNRNFFLFITNQYKVVLEPLVSPDLAIYIFKQVKVKMTLDLVMSPWSMSNMKLLIVYLWFKFSCNKSESVYKEFEWCH